VFRQSLYCYTSRFVGQIIWSLVVRESTDSVVCKAFPNEKRKRKRRRLHFTSPRRGTQPRHATAGHIAHAALCTAAPCRLQSAVLDSRQRTARSLASRCSNAVAASPAQRREQKSPRTRSGHGTLGDSPHARASRAEQLGFGRICPLGVRRRAARGDGSRISALSRRRSGGCWTDWARDWAFPPIGGWNAVRRKRNKSFQTIPLVFSSIK